MDGKLTFIAILKVVLIFCILMSAGELSFSEYGHFLMHNWQPPSGSVYRVASGQIVKSAADGSYDVIADDNKVIKLNCEPYPAINKCFTDNQWRPFHTIYKVSYVDIPVTNTNERENIILTIETGGTKIIDANERINFIRNTYVMSNQSGKINRRQISKRYEYKQQYSVLLLCRIFIEFCFLFIVSKFYSKLRKDMHLPKL